MRAIVLVCNDLVTDRRVERTCSALLKCGYDVQLIGRVLPDSLPMDARSYQVCRMRLLFNRHAWFYAELNLRLFFYILFNKVDLIYVNDLDTLLGGWLASRIKRKKLIYDSHEYFTEMPELQHNEFAYRIWLCIEKWILPTLKNTLTVNQSIADIYNKKYGLNMIAVRNISVNKTDWSVNSRSEIGLPEDKFIIVLQGTGINVDRGGEELVTAMQWIDGLLLIIGNGDAVPLLRKMVVELNLEQKVTFIPKQNARQLHSYTANANLGMSVDKNTNLNYYYSLPNKLFDYIQAGIPVLASDLPVIANVIEQYHVGDVFPSHEPSLLANSINALINNPERLLQYRTHLEIAAQELCWEKEEEKLLALIKKCQ